MKTLTSVPENYPDEDTSNVLGLPQGDHWPEKRKRKKRVKRKAKP